MSPLERAVVVAIGVSMALAWLVIACASIWGVHKFLLHTRVM